MNGEKESSIDSIYQTDGRNIIYYEYQNDKKVTKTAEIQESKLADEPNYFTIFDNIEMENLWQTFLYSLRLKVEKVTIQMSSDTRKDCYVISYMHSPNNDPHALTYDNKYYVDVETGLLYRVLNNGVNNTHEYEFNNVNEEVFIQPNIEEYEMRE